MNSDVSYAREYIVQTSSINHHNNNLSSSNLDGNCQKLLQRRQDRCGSAKKLPGGLATTFEQTMTFVENLKRNQHKTVIDKSRLSTQIFKENNSDNKSLTPQQLRYQLNLKLEHLIRTRVIEPHRVINRTNILPTPIIKSKGTPILVPKENFNRLIPSYLNQSTEKILVSSSVTTIDTIINQDDLVDKESFGDNDEACEEMVEEENITFLQQQP